MSSCITDFSIPNQVNCSCADLNPTTTVNDMENMFEKHEDIFIEDGLNRFSEFNFLESYQVYIFILEIAIVSYLLVKGYKLDINTTS